MKNSWIIIASLLGLLVACNKEMQIEAPEEEPVVVTYIKAEGNEDATKASVSGTDASFTWNTGDRIAVYADGYKISDDLESTYNAATNATFAFSGDNDVTQSSRANFAIFPASLVWDGTSIRSGSVSYYTSSSLKLTLPASYTLAQVQDDVSPTPMIATNAANGDLAFKALCPLLRVTVVNIPKQTKRIEFDFNGKKVQGEFTLTDVDPGTTAIATSETDGADDIITVTMVDNTTWHDNLVINLPVPTGTYGNITITAYDATSGGHAVLTLTKPIKSTGWTPTRKSSRKMTATLPVFSVGADTKVVFAPGNLQYDKSASKWSFMDHQYSTVETTSQYVGDIGDNYAIEYIVSLFGWATSGYSSATTSDNTWVNYQPWATSSSTGTVSTSTNYYEYGPSTSNIAVGTSWNDASHYDTWKVCDWGHNAIGSYAADTWRTLTKDQWLYLFGMEANNTDKDGHARYCKYFRAKVNSVQGIVVLPDDISGISNIPEESSRGKASTFGGKTYTTAEWTSLEAAGCVFLPAAGYRDGASVHVVGSKGLYWSSTAGDASRAYYLSFLSGYVDPASNTYRYYGRSVRLVRELN